MNPYDTGRTPVRDPYALTYKAEQVREADRILQRSAPLQLEADARGREFNPYGRSHGRSS